MVILCGRLTSISLSSVVGSQLGTPIKGSCLAKPSPQAFRWTLIVRSRPPSVRKTSQSSPPMKKNACGGRSDASDAENLDIMQLPVLDLPRSEHRPRRQDQ